MLELRDSTGWQEGEAWRVNGGTLSRGRKVGEEDIVRGSLDDEAPGLRKLAVHVLLRAIKDLGSGIGRARTRGTPLGSSTVRTGSFGATWPGMTRWRCGWRLCGGS